MNVEVELIRPKQSKPTTEVSPRNNEEIIKTQMTMNPFQISFLLLRLHQKDYLGSLCFHQIGKLSNSSWVPKPTTVPTQAIHDGWRGWGPATTIELLPRSTFFASR